MKPKATLWMTTAATRAPAHTAPRWSGSHMPRNGPDDSDDDIESGRSKPARRDQWPSPRP
jgi:hypothetical protein